MDKIKLTLITLKKEPTTRLQKICIEVIESLTTELDTTKQNVKEMRGIVESVAEDFETETEYDGQTLSSCFFCSANLWCSEPHKTDCEHLKAKTLLTSPPATKQVYND